MSLFNNNKKELCLKKATRNFYVKVKGLARKAKRVG